MRIKIKTRTPWERWRVATFYDKEPETIEWIDGFDGGTFWDIGANIGVFSLWCAYRHPQMRIHAFETMRANFLRLWENIFMNDHINTTAHHIALDVSDGNSALFAVPRTETGASGGQVGRPVKDAKEEYLVPVFTGDLLAQLYGVPAYVKIDTDGNEYEILCGMQSVLMSKSLKGVLVEVNNRREAVGDMMQAAGLRPDKRLNKCKTRESDFNVIFSRR